jgi:hypothetical protein
MFSGGCRGRHRSHPVEATPCLPAVFLAGPPQEGLPAIVHLVAGGVCYRGPAAESRRASSRNLLYASI